MKLRTILIASVAALISTSASAGVFILDGTDSDDHGFFDGTANQDGWLYIQTALENIAGSTDLTSTNPNVIAVLGASSTAATAATSALSGSSLSGTYTLVFLSDAEIGGFFANTNTAGRNSTDARILYIPSDGVSGGLTFTGAAALTANATGIDTFLGNGGGLFSMGHPYGWLNELIPGAAAVPPGSSSALTLTSAGSANFPGLTSADLSSGPWHYNFVNFGSIPVLATGLLNNQNVPVIIGGSGGSITVPPPVGGIPEPATWAMMLLGFGMLGGAMRRRHGVSAEFAAA